MIQIKKTIYDEPERSDGVRILVMRLWPRGIKKSSADAWMKDLGCERELMTEWRRGGVKLNIFRVRYVDSLRKHGAKQDLLNELVDQVRRGRTLTLLCSRSDSRKCHRFILKEELLRMI
ncbi:MAG: DUF488 domain-containing protein [Nitrososphaerales archaeon]